MEKEEEEEEGEGGHGWGMGEVGELGGGWRCWGWVLCGFYVCDQLWWGTLKIFLFLYIGVYNGNF